MQMSLFEDFGIRQIKEDVKKLELQIRTINMPDKLRFRKMNLLAELYENLGEFEKADNTALTVIKQGTVVARKDTEVLDIVRDAYCIRGKRHFDDYMIATEWNREKNARFWLPRRKILEGQLHLATKLDNFMNDPNMRLLSLSMPPGTGKQLSDDTPVMTSKGWKNHGDLKVGDRVIGLNGEYVKVTHVFPKAEQDCQVWFGNKGSLYCHENHEWVIYDPFDNFRIAIVDTKTLEQMFESPYRKFTEIQVIDRDFKFGKERKLPRFAITHVCRIRPKKIGNCIEVEGGIYCVGEHLIPTHNSTLIKFLLAYIAGVYPMSANMYVSYSDGMIKMMYDSVVDMLTDDFEYQHTRIFGERAAPVTSAQYGTISYRRRGDFPTIGMISLGGSVTGRTRANKFLITDDLVKNAEVARSPERLEKLWQDYTSTLTTRQIGDNVKQIMLGTIWSAYDPISRMMSEHENDPQYEFVCIPVWDENEHSNFLYDHPDRYTDEKIRERQESLDPVDFSCLYLQNPVEKEGMPLKANELMYYNGVLPDGEPDDIFFVTDVAWGGGDSLSMPVIYAYGDDWYLHDVVFDTSNKEVTRPRVVGKILQHACKSGRFEANNGGDEYADKVDEILRNDYGYMCNITSQKAPTNMGKLVRIEQYIPEIKKVYYRGKDFRDEEYNRFMKELCSISFRSKNLHDDAADSMAMAVDYKNTKVRHCKVTKFKRNGNL